LVGRHRYRGEKRLPQGAFQPAPCSIDTSKDKIFADGMAATRFAAN